MTGIIWDYVTSTFSWSLQLGSIPDKTTTAPHFTFNLITSLLETFWQIVCWYMYAEQGVEWVRAFIIWRLISPFQNEAKCIQQKDHMQNSGCKWLLDTQMIESWAKVTVRHTSNQSVCRKGWTLYKHVWIKHCPLLRSQMSWLENVDRFHH